jgi:ubiquitin-conjugating enzyme E2 W
LEKLTESSARDGLNVNVISETEWQVQIQGAVGTLYENEDFVIRIRFSAEYPIESPEVVFLVPAPIHPHIYTNGHICLNILGEDWSPALTVQSICLSLLSMLSSATEKVSPPDNSSYVRSKGVGSTPKNTRFVYHDDAV